MLAEALAHPPTGTEVGGSARKRTAIHSLPSPSVTAYPTQLRPFIKVMLGPYYYYYYYYCCYYCCSSHDYYYSY